MNPAIKRASDALMEAADVFSARVEEGEPCVQSSLTKILEMIGDLGFIESDIELEQAFRDPD